ncbi:hypothetical protein ABIA38_009020 [Embleya sp. AB8]
MTGRGGGGHGGRKGGGHGHGRSGGRTPTPRDASRVRSSAARHPDGRSARTGWAPRARSAADRATNRSGDGPGPARR